MICIDSAQALQKLRDDPKGSYCLTADIDLEGALWKPVDFDGTLEGNGKCISHFRIVTATEAGHQGFFGCLGNNARVTGLQLADIALATAKNAREVGAIAGVNHGSITDCCVGKDAPYEPIKSKKRNYLTGVCDDSWLSAEDERAVRIGAIAGTNHGRITGVRSYARQLTDGQGLCGRNEGRVEGLYRDVSHRSELLPKVAVDMRREIVSHMERQGNFRWIPSKDMAFTSAYTGSFKVYEKDQVHYGLPYTQKNGSVERARYCLDKDDYVASWLPEFSDAAPQAQGCQETPWDVFMGNDCSGAVYWSWQRACPRIEFGYSGDMVPTPENQRLYDVLPLGDYHADTLLTKDVIEANTRERIAECYPLLRLGDAIIMRDPGYGHTRLVARDPMVMRREDGSLDIDESYVPTHEHGVGKGSSGRLSTWQLDARYTFRDLLDTFYLPITNSQLLAGVPAPVELTAQNITGPFSGTVRANYRIISTTVSLTEQATGAQYQSVRFTALDENRHKKTPREDGFARSTVREVALQAHMQQLPAGNYDFTVCVQLSTGNTYQIHQGHCTI